ncbi:Glycosyl hydrolases family 18 [Micrococcales bacterium KH10]|nr:Glycosyl hydrolases family 18 [Micrococcales bacterium KH10]
MGGWTYSRHFSRAAATDASRKALVSSCIDIYIKGNLPVFDGFGGPGTGAGIFDGIDIDWEWPGTHNGLDGNYVDEANDRQNFKLLLKEFREQLDALGAQNDRHYLLSGFLPANPEDIQGGGWNDPELFDYFDFGNIQGYDLWGAWDLTMTGHQANLWDDPNDPRPAGKRFSIDKAVKAYVNNGIDPAQLGIGVAGYGRGWANVQSNDPWTPGTLSAAQGVYEAGINDYDVIEGTCTQHYDPVAGAAWCYNPSTKIWWSLDNKDSVRAKADYIVSQGLGGGMWWELSGDEENELGSELTTKLENAPKGPIDVDSPGTDPGGNNPGGDDDGTNPGGGDDGGTNPGGGDGSGDGDNGTNPGGPGDNPGDGDNGGQNPGGPNDDNQGGDPKQTPPRVTWHFDDYSVAVSGLRTTFRKPAKITVKATKNGRPTTGAVRFSYQVGKKAKTKSLTLSADGTAAVKLPKKLKVGKHQVHVSLTPTGSATSSRTVIVRVKRAKVRVVKQRVLGGSARLHISRGRSARLALVFKSTKGVKLKGKIKVFVGRKHVGSGKVVRKSGKWTAQVSVRKTAKKGKVYVKITGNKSVAKAKIKTKIRAK